MDTANRVREVIPMKKRRAYRARSVKQVKWEVVGDGRGGQGVHVGFDVGKEAVLTVLRWGEDQFERPWLAKNPDEIRELVGLLVRVAGGRPLTLAMEPTGTYGDGLRQALAEAGLPLRRVGTKAAHDYAEIFDGVPSQHDGKDAAVVAELAAQGKSKEWAWKAPSAAEQEMAYWVDWMDAQQRQGTMWLGRLEALLARHWPEATRWLKVSSGTLLRVLERYGGPGGLASDREGASRLGRWGGYYLKPETIEGLIESARRSVGVKQGVVDVQRMQQYAREALAARREIGRSRRRLQQLAQGKERIQLQARAVGVATACVLWVYLGDPCDYHCGEAYRKAMGLNLAERSSGKYQGKLKISKRGFPPVRRWLYFAALRLVKQGPIARWYQRKKAKDAERAKGAVVGVMRKLALGLHRTAVSGEEFQARRLFPGHRVRGSGRSCVVQ
jgi:transposase